MEQEVRNFFLMLCRFGVLFWLPLTGPMAKIPTTIRMTVVTALVLALFIMQRDTINTLLTNSAPAFIVLCVYEFILGLLFSFIFAVPAVVLLFFGRAIDMQIGLSAAGIFNPISHGHESLIGTLLVLAGMALFWSFALHLDVLSILLKTLDVMPLGQWHNVNFSIVMNYFSTAFLIGMYLAFPVMATLFLIDIAVGFVSKGMPQMNVYFVMLPLKIMVGFIVIAISLQQLAGYFEQLVYSPVRFMLEYF